MNSKRHRSPPLSDQAALERLLRQRNDLSGAAIIHLAWYAALTATEICALRWRDVSFSPAQLTVDQRTIPMAPELVAYLEALPRKSTFVVSNGRGIGQYSRGSVSRKVRPLLDAAGLSGVTLQDLRNGGILRFLEEYSLEETARITGCEIRTIQELHRRFQPEAAAPRRKEKEMTFSPVALRSALEREGDTLDARVVFLSWQGGLLVREMAQLRWQDVDLEAQTWRIGEDRRPIPTGMLPHLHRWSAQEYPEQFLLRGVRSGAAVEPAFLARRGAEFFSRYGLETYSLPAIRGKMEDVEECRRRVLTFLREKEQAGRKELLAVIGLPAADGKRLLTEMAAAGLIQREATGRRYTVPGLGTIEERIRRYCEEKAGGQVTSKELADALGIAQNLANYYIRKLIAEGSFIKERYGLYRVLS